MLFNINGYVKVRLTPYGRRLLAEEDKALGVRYPYLNEVLKEKTEDEDGWSRWQMWELMSRPGQHCSVGLQQSFEIKIIIERQETCSQIASHQGSQK